MTDLASEKQKTIESISRLIYVRMADFKAKREIGLNSENDLNEFKNRDVQEPNKQAIVEFDCKAIAGDELSLKAGEIITT